MSSHDAEHVEAPPTDPQSAAPVRAGEPGAAPGGEISEGDPATPDSVGPQTL